MLTLAREAMATRFELVLPGGDAIRLRAVGEEALDEVERIEAQLSFYRETSEIRGINARAGREPVRVEPTLFALLRRAESLCRATDGAFDITVAPLVRCWGFIGGTGRLPDPTEVAAAREVVGMHLVRLNEADLTVEFLKEGVMLDLGAIGKGYAIERAAEILKDGGVTSALIHGGTSTIYAIGAPPREDAWTIALPRPEAAGRGPSWGERAGAPDAAAVLATVSLRDEALSVSAVWGRAFTAGGIRYGHVLDPRLGRPVSEAVLAAVITQSATETDALSTALLVAGGAGQERIAALRPGMRTLVVGQGKEGAVRIQARGIEVSP